MNNPIYEYKGQSIEFQEYGEKWTWQGFENASLAKVKEYIDRNISKRWVPTDAYYQDYDEIKIVKVRSAGSDGSLWIQSDRKARGQKAYRTLYVLSDENTARLERIKTLTAERERVNALIDAELDAMQVFRASDIKVAENASKGNSASLAAT